MNDYPKRIARRKIMVGKISKSLLLVLVLTLVSAGVVFAGEDTSPEKDRFLGNITDIDAEANSFSIQSRAGRDLSFRTIERTVFRSRDGSIQSLDDLSIGMNALVSAYRDHEGNLVALMVAAGEDAKLDDLQRFKGIISAVDIERRSFSLEMEEGRVHQFVVNDRTRYKSRDGSISDLADLENGMVAYVVAIERDTQAPLALMVAAGNPAERPNRFRVFGQIKNVIPGQETFELETKNGDLLALQVVDRTIFRSRDTSINSIHDLKTGMHALVIGVREMDGSIIALAVATVDLDDNPGLDRLDIRAIGKISSIGDHSFVLETQGQGLLSFSVGGSTIYKSRDRNIETFENLQIGMIVVVGGMELGNGEYKAVVIGAASPRNERVEESIQLRSTTPDLE
jgi:hypothetical protein